MRGIVLANMCRSEKCMVDFQLANQFSLFQLHWSNAVQPNLIHQQFNGLGKEPLERWNFTSILSLGPLRRIHFHFAKYSSLLIQCRRKVMGCGLHCIKSKLYLAKWKWILRSGPKLKMLVKFYLSNGSFPNLLNWWRIRIGCTASDQCYWNKENWFVNWKSTMHFSDLHATGPPTFLFSHWIKETFLCTQIMLLLVLSPSLLQAWMPVPENK